MAWVLQLNVERESVSMHFFETSSVSSPNNCFSFPFLLIGCHSNHQHPCGETRLADGLYAPI